MSKIASRDTGEGNWKKSKNSGSDLYQKESLLEQVLNDMLNSQTPYVELSESEIENAWRDFEKRIASKQSNADWKRSVRKEFENIVFLQPMSKENANLGIIECDKAKYVGRAK